MKLQKNEEFDNCGSYAYSESYELYSETNVINAIEKLKERN
jgi:hypothetical protein